MKKISIIFFLTIFFYGCKENKKDLTTALIGSYELSGLDGEDFSTQKDKLEVTISLFPDDVYTEVTNAGNYVYGKWQYNLDSSIVKLQPVINLKTAKTPGVIDSTGMLELVYQNKSTLKDYRFLRHEIKDSIIESNPYYPMKPKPVFG